MAARRSPNALHAILAALTLGFAFAPLHAHADDVAAAPEARPVPLLTSEILQIIDDFERPAIGPDWLDMHLDRMSLSKRHGLTYTHEMVGAEKPMIFKLRGPLLRKPLSNRRRTIGLSIEVEF